MKIKSIVLFLLTIVILTCPVLAEISISMNGKTNYNLGEKVNPSISVKEDEIYSGFFNAKIKCDDYSVQYYAIPIDIEKDIRTTVGVPPLSLRTEMKGNCAIEASLYDSGNDFTEAKESENFFVSNELRVDINGNFDVKPGEEIDITGEVRKISGELAKNTPLELMFKNENIELNSRGKFEHTIKIDEKENTGKLSLIVVAKDEYGNYGDKLIKINVLPIPTNIENRIEKETINPGEELNFKVALYDHNNYIIEDYEIETTIVDLENKAIISKKTKSTEDIIFETKKDLAPGEYKIISKFQNITKEDSFFISELKEIYLSYENGIVQVTNTGNVDYKNEVILNLKGKEKDYEISQKLKLLPGETKSIDLSKKVPKGNYDIYFPEDSAQENKVVLNAGIDDNRNILKKVLGGLNTVTGAVVGTAEYALSKPKIASFILISMVLGILGYYGRGFIKQKIKGEKKEELSGIFKDFEYIKK